MRRDGEKSSNRGRAAHVAPIYLLIGLTALLAGLVVGSLALRPPAPVSASAAPDGFSAERVLPLIQRLLGDTAPHPIGTVANATLRGRLIAEVEALGLEATTQEAFACRERWSLCGHVVNVMARVPGTTDGPAVLLTAHYDSVGAGPGVSDDLVGVGVILETARLLLAGGPIRNPVILLFTDGEEVGLLGAEAFALHPWLNDVGVVVNVEARGTAGQSTLFETSDQNAWLIEAFAAEATRPVANSLLYELYRLLPNDTDFSVYKEAGLPGVNFAYFDEVAHYHTPLDDLAHLDRGSLQHHGDNVLAAARTFGALDLSDPPEGDSIYLDLVPGYLARVPAGWAVPLAVAGLLLWLVIVMVLVRRRALDVPGLLLGVLATLLGLAFAGALAFGVVEAIAAITGRSAFFHAEPLPTRSAVWLAALLGTLLAATPLARRAGFWGLATGMWLTWGLFSVAIAIMLPGVSVFFLVPLLVSAACFALAVLVAGAPTRTAWPGPLAGALATFVIAYLWFSLALSLESGLGLDLAAAVAVCVALVLASFTPLLAQPPGRARSRGALLLVTVAALVASGGWATTVQDFSQFRPQRLNLMHLQQAEEGLPTAAWWLLEASPGPAPAAAFSAVADYERGLTPPLPWNGAGFAGTGLLSAAGPPHGVSVPTLTVVADEETSAGRVLTVRLDSPRGAPRLGLMVPADAGLEHIAIPGTPYELTVDSDTEGAAGTARTVFSCHGTACDGTTLALRFSGVATAPLTLTVADLDYGLPPGGAALREARPPNAVQSQDGDVNMMSNRVTIPAP